MSEKEEVVRVMAQAVASTNADARWPKESAVSLLQALEAKGYTLTRRHGVVHEREGFAAREDASTAGAKRGGEGGNE